MDKVMLSLRGTQTYPEQEPEVIELVTEGTLETLENGWEIRYEESDLTGLDGVTTSFRIEGDTVTLTRTGNLNSQMVFKEGVSHDSLYQMPFGALLITVCATRIDARIRAGGGTVDLSYTIAIEQSASGCVDYHLDIKPM